MIWGNPWLDLSLDALRLGLESQHVIVLRLLRTSEGGPEAHAELSLMVTEKIEACLDLGRETMIAGLGAFGPGHAARALRLVGRRVRANRLRLSNDG